MNNRRDIGKSDFSGKISRDNSYPSWMGTICQQGLPYVQNKFCFFRNHDLNLLFIVKNKNLFLLGHELG